MEIILLHSAQVEASRNVLAELPVGVTVIDKHSEAVATCPNFSAYPALVVKEDDRTMRVLSPFSTWTEAQAFIDNPPAPPVEQRKTELTKLEFLGLLAEAEKVSLKAKETSDPVVGVFWEEFRASEFIDLTDPRTIRGVQSLEDSDNLAEGRAAQILAGEAPA